MSNKVKPSCRILFLALLLALLTGCGQGYRDRSAERLPEGCSESSLVHDGMTRWYRICLPDPLPESAALVLHLHGGTLSMRSLFSPLADSSNSWLSLVNEEGVILLAPNGTNPEKGDTYGDDQVWNDLRPDQASGQSQVDDVGYLLALLDQVSADLPVDPDRVYITGASNGGMMTYRMLLEAPSRFAAGAAFIANLPDTGSPLPEPAQPVPIMIANGTEDPLMPYEGGIVAKDRGVVISTQQTVDWWVRVNKADPGGMSTRTLPDLNPDDRCRVEEITYPPAEGGAEVRLYRIEGGGHTLPTLGEPGFILRAAAGLLGPTCQDADGVRLAWEFFTSVSSPPSPDTP